MLHDWPDERCAVILRNCRLAMPPHARVLIVERVMPARMEPVPGHRALAWSDLHMLVAVGGRERTEAEFVDLLASAALEVTRVLPIGLDFSVIEGVRTDMERKS